MFSKYIYKLTIQYFWYTGQIGTSSQMIFLGGVSALETRNRNNAEMRGAPLTNVFDPKIPS